jgi:hypothetical protein
MKPRDKLTDLLVLKEKLREKKKDEDHAAAEVTRKKKDQLKQKAKAEDDFKQSLETLSGVRLNEWQGRLPMTGKTSQLAQRR